MNYKDMSFADFLTVYCMRSSHLGKSSTSMISILPAAFRLWYFQRTGHRNMIERNTLTDNAKYSRDEVKEYFRIHGFSQYDEKSFVLDEGSSDKAFVSLGSDIDRTAIGIDGDAAVVKAILDYFRPYAPEEKKKLRSIIDIDVKGDARVMFTDLDSLNRKPILASSYPFLKQSVAEIAASFKAARARLLLLIGPPGTGKTNLLSEIIRLMEIPATACSDSTLLQNRKLYVDFMANDQKLLVLEDADLVVEERSKGNAVMSLLLNILDGLATIDKRIIISTNLPTLKSVDEALFRPGRCHDVLEFKKLTLLQAQMARDGLGLPSIELATQASWKAGDLIYSLSEAMNYETVRNIAAHQKKNIGY